MEGKQGGVRVTYVIHFGVKGMHWGVRKSRTGASSKVMKKPRTPQEVAARRQARNRRLALAGAALVVAGPELMHHTVTILNTVAGHKREEAGRRAAANIFADSKGIPSFESINLTFNSSSNTWE
jgi:hypothetical protein